MTQIPNLKLSLFQAEYRIEFHGHLCSNDCIYAASRYWALAFEQALGTVMILKLCQMCSMYVLCTIRIAGQFKPES